MCESDSINLGDQSTSSQRRGRPLSPSDHTAIDIINAENDVLHHSESSLSSKRGRIKWTLLFCSFMVEGLSSAFDQLSVPEKSIYALMAMLMASLGLILSIIDLYYRVQEQKMTIWRLPEDALENFGFFASIWQCIYSIIEYNCIKKKHNNPIKMSVLPPIFLICVAISRLCSNYRGDQISLRHSHSSGESSMDALTSSRHGASVSVSNASDNEEDEWLEQDEPGVRFSREMFREETAENPSLSLEEEEIVARLKSPEVHEQELAAIWLRKITRTKEERRVSLCSPRLLSSLRSLIMSRYCDVQTNALASLVNLSLEKSNKVKIVRAGFVPLLIDVLKGGSSEAQKHAAGALFSLALEDDNKMAIGILGALQPLMYSLRSDSQRTRHDSALALYHLTLIQSNRVKLVKLGVVSSLLGMVNSGDLINQILLILCNVASCHEGRSAMFDVNSVAILVGILRDGEAELEAIRENCVTVLFSLSHDSFRFKGLAKEARAVDVLREIEERGSKRAREKAKMILRNMKGKGE